MNVPEILEELQALGTAPIKNIFRKHGAPEPSYGVKVEDLKKIQKRIKTNYQLALDLYDTGVSDAMYLAGLISDPKRMTPKDLQHWAEKSTWYMTSEYALAWTASESDHGMEMALKWIDSDDEKIACAGWATLSNVVLLKPDGELDIPVLTALLDRVTKTIHQSPNRVRYVMNGYVIALGGGVKALTDRALKAAAKIGKVSVNLGDTACKVPDATAYIHKMEAKGVIGRKRKTAKC